MGDDGDQSGTYCYHSYRSTPRLYPTGGSLDSKWKTRAEDVVRAECHKKTGKIRFFRNDQFVGEQSITKADLSEDLMPLFSVYHSSTSVVLQRAETYPMHTDHCGRSGQILSIARQKPGWRIKIALEAGGRVLDFPSSTLSSARRHQSPLLFLACSIPEGDDLGKFLLDSLPQASSADEKDTAQLLRLACKNGLAQVIDILLARNSGANFRDRHVDLQGLLASLCVAGHSQAAKVLLEQKADLNQATDEGHTPLMLACKGLHADVARVLIEFGASVDVLSDPDPPPFNPGDMTRVNAFTEEYRQAFLDVLEIKYWTFDKFESRSRRSGKIIDQGTGLQGQGDWYWCAGPAVPTSTSCFYSFKIDQVESTSDLYFGYGDSSLVRPWRSATCSKWGVP